MRGGVIGPTTISYEIIEEIQPIAALEACHYGWYAYKTAQERLTGVARSWKMSEQTTDLKKTWQALAQSALYATFSLKQLALTMDFLNREEYYRLEWPYGYTEEDYQRWSKERPL